MKYRFLDLGMQPIANNFLADIPEKDCEFKFHLTVSYDDETALVSLDDFVPPELMFNENYVYHSSMSKTMRDHFLSAANHLKSKLRYKFLNFVNTKKNNILVRDRSDYINNTMRITIGQPEDMKTIAKIINKYSV